MSDVASKNKALMRRVYEEMWNGANPTLAQRFSQIRKAWRGSSASSFYPSRICSTRSKGMIAEGDQVAVHFSAHGTHSGPWLRFAPTGSSIHYTGVTLARIAEDKIIEHYTWWDKAALIEQLEGD